MQQRIQEREIETTFGGLDLLPGNRHEHGIRFQLLDGRPHLWQYGRPCARVVHLRAENDVRLAVDEQRVTAILLDDARQFGGVDGRRDGEKSRKKTQKRPCMVRTTAVPR
jgi:hypothetical protein